MHLKIPLHDKAKQSSGSIANALLAQRIASSYSSNILKHAAKIVNIILPLQYSEKQCFGFKINALSAHIIAFLYYPSILRLAANKYYNCNTFTPCC